MARLPKTKSIASMTLLFPLPFGPTTAEKHCTNTYTSHYPNYAMRMSKFTLTLIQFPCFFEEEKSAYIDTSNKNANSMASMALLFPPPFGPTTAE